MSEEDDNQELCQAFKTKLEKDGTMGKLRANIRLALMSFLDRSNSRSRSFPVEIPTEIQLINHLIREYLNWTNCKNTEIMFKDESNLSDYMSRETMVAKLGMEETEYTKEFPLLVLVLDDYVQY